MGKIVLITGMVIVAAVCTYAMVLNSPRPKAASESVPEETVTEEPEPVPEAVCDPETGWTVEFIDKNRKPVKPGSGRPAPAPGYVWSAEDPSDLKAGSAKPNAPRASPRADKLPSGSGGG